VVGLRPEDGAYLEHPLEAGYDRELLVELGRLGQEGGLAEVDDGEDLGASLRSGPDYLGGEDLHEPFRGEVLPELLGHPGLKQEDLSDLRVPDVQPPELQPRVEYC